VQDPSRGQSGPADSAGEAGTPAPVPARRLAVRPAGAPDRPLLEAGLLLAAFYLASYLPSDPGAAGAALGDPSFQLLLLAGLLPKAALTLYMMARAEGLAAFGVRAPRLADLPRGFVAAAGAFAAALLPALALSALGYRNPLLAGIGAPTAPPLLLLPLVAATALAVGYSEELFFRAYLVRRLSQAGLSLPWAALASCVVFASAHGLQGLPGLALALLLGLWFTWRWLSGRNLHEIALGHALYDFGVMAAALYG